MSRYSSLQENIKEKENIIDKMKAASSNLPKTLLSDEQKRSAKLEKERKSLHEEGPRTLV